jgi:putative transposase
LLKDCQSPEEILGQQGLLKQLTKRLVERALAGELTAHLGHEPGEAKEETGGNRRNGRSHKTLQTDTGPLAVEVPRDRAGSFEPQLVKKRPSSTIWIR